MTSATSAMTSDGQIKHVLVVGGGTAGWLSACHLAKQLRSNTPDGVKVTLVESKDIPTIGVGEGTVPAFTKTLRELGIRETDFIRECDGTFKQSVRFVDWCDNPGTVTNNFYHHVFDYPVEEGVDLTPYWLMGAAGDKSYVDTVSRQGVLCEMGLGPKVMTQAEFEGTSNYAYHLDAAKFALLLTKHATQNLGVEHLLGTVDGVNLAENGDVKSISTKEHGELAADIFVDCTGFRALLIEKEMGVGFVDKQDTLFADHAVAIQTPYLAPDDPIACHTISTAKEAGWIWDIGLSERRGTGYVYSSAHTDHDTAEKVIRDYLRESIGEKADELSSRRISMKIGYREQPWTKNVVAIGLSQGFVEPLEATGLLVFDATAKMLASQFPAHRDNVDVLAKRFNKRICFTWERVIDFVKLHYCISRRDDSQFWVDNRDEKSIPDSLLESLEQWRYQPPSVYDFTSKISVFNLENYLYILYGMGFETNIGPLKPRYTDGEKATKIIGEIDAWAKNTAPHLLPHRELIERIKKFGLQRV
jgi:tryptophan halogenase